MGPLTILPVPGLPEVERGADLAGMIAGAAEAAGTPLVDGDCVVVTQKVVSKAEGRVVALDPEDREARRDLIADESRRVLRRRDELVISETPHGFVCANAGVDQSNVATGHATLLPTDPDRSARRIRDALAARGVDVAVIVTDTFGRPWRHGLVDVAIGVGGLAPIVDLRGGNDASGRELTVTEVAIADEIAGAAELVMGKSSGIPAAIVRGISERWRREGSVRELTRRPSEDLFR